MVEIQGNQFRTHIAASVSHSPRPNVLRRSP
jgi:hypothetical protein